MRVQQCPLFTFALTLVKDRLDGVLLDVEVPPAEFEANHWASTEPEHYP